MIKVGDIVKTKSKDGKKTIFAVVIKTSTYKGYKTGQGRELTDINVIFADGDYGYRSNGKYTETGRHIDMQSVLDSIK